MPLPRDWFIMAPLEIATGDRHLLCFEILDIEIQVVESFQRFALSCLDPENLALMILPVFQRFFLYICDGSSAQAYVQSADSSDGDIAENQFTGQIIPTSSEVTPNGALVEESPQNALRFWNYSSLLRIHFNFVLFSPLVFHLIYILMSACYAGFKQAVYCTAAGTALAATKKMHCLLDL